VTSLQINLSTAINGPDSLSPVFAENAGNNNAIVRGPGFLTMVSGCSPNLEPQFFELFIQFDRPFLYDPKAGNLLLDIRNISGPQTDGSLLVMDAVNTVGDSTSSIIAFEVNASTASGITSQGFVTRFEIIPMPHLTIEQKTNVVLVSWGAPSVLQSVSNLRVATNWQTITTNITYSSNGFTAFYSPPLDSLTNAQFF